MTLVNVRESTPVSVGALKFYCEKFTVSSSTDIKQDVTVIGSPVVTNKFKHFSHITLSGRIHNTATPLSFLINAMNVNGMENIDVIYRGIKLQKCYMTGFTAEDSGEEYIYITVNLVTAYSAVKYNG